MNINKIRAVGLISSILIISSLIIGYQGWQNYVNVTINVEWTTATEINTAGFNVYRSDHPEGPYQRINTIAIPGSSDQLTGGSYVFPDFDVEPDRTYYYELEEIEYDGDVSSFGPIEIEARRGGQIEGIMGAVFFLLGLIGLLLTGFRSEIERYD